MIESNKRKTSTPKARKDEGERGREKKCLSSPFPLFPFPLFSISILLLLTLAACASTQDQGASTSPDTITRADITAYAGTYSNALQLVERLQPHWLRKRGRASVNTVAEGDIVIYLNDVRIGGPEALREISLDGIAEIRYLNAAKAARYGTGHQHGAILVRMHLTVSDTRRPLVRWLSEKIPSS